jgi:hypothetical protein
MKHKCFSLPLAALALLLPFMAVSAFGQAQAVLTHEIPNPGAQSIGQLPADQIMTLDVVLPMRDQASLDVLAKQIADPASPSYRHFSLRRSSPRGLDPVRRIMTHWFNS